MSQYTSGTTLDYMIARVRACKPNADQSEIVNALNSRIRMTIASRIYWSDLLAKRVISFPNQYNTGTVSFVSGSNVATLTGTAYPFDDSVSTVSTTLVLDTGYSQVTPGSMQNIAVDTLLYCDAGGSNPEVVAVVEVTPTSFWANFQYAHGTANWTIWSSSLSGLQLNSGDDYPIFDVMAITNNQTIIMDQPWGGPNTTLAPYQIFKMYTTIDPLLKVILSVVDPQQGIPLQLYVPIEKLDAIDPQRSSQMNPLCLAQYTPTPAGSMRYEVYPSVTEAYQLRAIVGLQWPDLKYDTDRAPWFIDSNLFVTGACADVIRIRNARMETNGSDPWFNPQLAMQYEQMFRLQLADCVNADEAKAQRAFSSMTQDFGFLGQAGGNYWVNHDLDNLLRNF